MGRVIAVVGAQYGSEGKGNIVQAMIENGLTGATHVRTGGPNAGHTIYKGDKEWKMQTVPCGWIDSTSYLMIGAGAVLDVHQLKTELANLELAGNGDVRHRIAVDRNCSVLDGTHKEAEGGVDGSIHSRIGSTGKGVGACREERMKRNDKIGHKLAKDDKWLQKQHVLTDTVSMLHNHHDLDRDILLEGTQGTGLSLVHGPWPYVTSADTTAGQFMVDAGLHPRMLTDVVLVARTFPIRVAGNSGPLFGELTWDQMSEHMGIRTEERTTVTNKVRRIGQWDEEDFLRAVRLNGPTQIALNFIDYLSPEDRGVKEYDHLCQRSKQFIGYVERIANCPVTMIGTGGPTCQVIYR